MLIKDIDEIETGYVKWVQTPSGVMIGGMKSNPDYLQITQDGRNFMAGLSSESIGY